MPGQSSKTWPAATRITNEVKAIIERRIAKSKKFKSIHLYIQWLVTRDALRKR